MGAQLATISSLCTCKSLHARTRLSKYTPHSSTTSNTYSSFSSSLSCMLRNVPVLVYSNQMKLSLYVEQSKGTNRLNGNCSLEVNSLDTLWRIHGHLPCQRNILTRLSSRSRIYANHARQSNSLRSHCTHTHTHTHMFRLPSSLLCPQKAHLSCDS